jgi:hypothetical protein
MDMSICHKISTHFANKIISQIDSVMNMYQVKNFRSFSTSVFPEFFNCAKKKQKKHPNLLTLLTKIHTKKKIFNSEYIFLINFFHIFIPLLVIQFFDEKIQYESFYIFGPQWRHFTYKVDLSSTNHLTGINMIYPLHKLL